MKLRLTDYIVSEEDNMKKPKRYAQVDLTGAEGLYETTVDRWSRRAKHPLSHNELANAGNPPLFEIGDKVLYENIETTVKIPQGPHNSVGIMLNGHLTMVNEDKLNKLVTEGAMGGAMGSVIGMPAINRMMQLAGLDHTGSTIAEQSVVTEADSDDMINKMVQQAAMLPQYKGNEEAARLYTIGALLATIGKTVSANPPQTVAGRQKLQTLNTLAVMGADLIKTAQTMTSPNQPNIPANPGTPGVPGAL
jgi:hypothetical protein